MLSKSADCISIQKKKSKLKGSISKLKHSLIANIFSYLLMLQL